MKLFNWRTLIKQYFYLSLKNRLIAKMLRMAIFTATAMQIGRRH